MGGGVQPLDRLRPRRQQRGLMLVVLPSWRMRGLCADLRGWHRGARAWRPLLQDEVWALVAVGLCVVLEGSVWRMWRQMRDDELPRALDVVMRDVRLVREGV